MVAEYVGAGLDAVEGARDPAQEPVQAAGFYNCNIVQPQSYEVVFNLINILSRKESNSSNNII